MNMRLEQPYHKVLHPLVDSKIGAVDYESSEDADHHALFVALLPPEFVLDEGFQRGLPGLYIGFDCVERVAPKVVNESCNEGGTQLTDQFGIFSFLFAEDVHHADVETSEVHSQSRPFFDHRVRQASVYLPQSCKFMHPKYMKHPMRGSHLLHTRIKLRLYLGELDGRIDHRAAHACHKTRGHQLRLFGDLQLAHYVEEGFEDGELQGCGHSDEEIHGACSAVEGTKEATVVGQLAFEVIQGQGLIELQLGLHEIQWHSCGYQRPSRYVTCEKLDKKFLHRSCSPLIIINTGKRPKAIILSHF